MGRAAFLERHAVRPQAHALLPETRPISGAVFDFAYTLLMSHSTMSHSTSEKSATSQKERAQLPPEIWVQVLGYLQETLPPPTGKCQRSDIRQTSLAVAMRISKVGYEELRLVSNHLA